MTYEQKQIKARPRRFRNVDSLAAGIYAVKSVRGTVTAGGKAAARSIGTLGAERDPQRRFISSAKGNGLSRMDEPLKPLRSGLRAKGERLTCSDQTGISPRLQSVRGNSVSAELRPLQTGREAGNLSVDRLHGRRRITSQSTNGRKTGTVEASQKNANGSPATGRSTHRTSRHGTKRHQAGDEIADFVPPRDKTPCFWGVHRPATGHLYILTMCTPISSQGSSK